jgi:hypothetical protein
MIDEDSLAGWSIPVSKNSPAKVLRSLARMIQAFWKMATFFSQGKKSEKAHISPVKWPIVTIVQNSLDYFVV